MYFLSWYRPDPSAREALRYPLRFWLLIIDPVIEVYDNEGELRVNEKAHFIKAYIAHFEIQFNSLNFCGIMKKMYSMIRNNHYYI